MLQQSTTISTQKAPEVKAKPEQQPENHEVSWTQEYKNGNPLSGRFPDSSFRSGLGIIQPKLEIGAPDDALEQEADAVAEHVVGMVNAMQIDKALPQNESFSPMRSEAQGTQVKQSHQLAPANAMGPMTTTAPMTRMASQPLFTPVRGRTQPATTQAKCAECAKKEEEEESHEHTHEGHVQRFSADNPQDDHRPGIVQKKCSKCAAAEEEAKVQTKREQGYGPQGSAMLQTKLNATKGNGNPLPQSLQTTLGAVYGADLGKVRIHHDDQAAAMADSIHAQAFTHGADIYFANGRYQPHDAAGLRLLAHELTHTIQQGAINTAAFVDAKTDEHIQRSCNALASEFKGSDYTTAEGKEKIKKRIAECAKEDMGKMKEELAKKPESPENDPATKDNFTKLKTAYENGINQIKEHKNPANKIIRGDYMKIILDLLLKHKLGAYALVGGFEENYPMALLLGDLTFSMDTQQLLNLQDNGKKWKADPEEVCMKEIVKHYYKLIGMEPPSGQGEPSWKKYVGGLTPNAPAFPASIVGPDTMVKSSMAAYTMNLDWSIEGKDLLSMTAAASNYVYYTWEVYDVSKHYQEQLEAKAAAIVDMKEGRGDPNAGGPSMADVNMKRAETQAVDPNAEVSGGDARSNRRKHLIDKQVEQFKNNWEDLKDPSRSSDGSVIGNVTTRLTAAFNIAGTQLAAEFAALGELLNTFADLMGNRFYEKEIPFPDQEGWFLIRALARPKPYGKDDKLTVRTPSVATKVVKVREIKAYGKEQVADIDKNLEARQTEIENNLKNAKDDKERERLNQELAQVKLEQTGSADAILEAQLAKMKEVAAKETSYLRKKDLEKKIKEMEAQVETAKARKAEFKNKFYFRPRAVFVSEERGEAIPLLFQVGEINNTDLTGPKIKYRVSDVTGKGGDNYEGNGDTPEAALKMAFKDFADKSPYGLGFLTVNLPADAKITLDTTQFRCITRGSAQAMERLEQALTVMTILATLAVPGVGEVAMIAGAVIAAQRIYNRVQNHTFAWDAAAITDILTLLGAAAQGAAVLGKMRVVRASKQFAMVADSPAFSEVNNFIAGLNRTASRLELISEFANWGSFFYGSMTTLQEYLSVSADEIAGRISKAEARRRKANLIAGAIQQGALQFASVDPAAMKEKIDGSFGKPQDGSQTPGQHAGTKDLDPNAPKDQPAVKKDMPADPQGGIVDKSKATNDPPAVSNEPPKVVSDKPVDPAAQPKDQPATDKPKDQPADGQGPKVEQKDGGAGPGDKAAKPADPALDAPGNKTAPPAKFKLAPEVAEANMKALEKKLGKMPEGLRDLLVHDHELLKNAAAEPNLITKKNMDAWSEIGQLMPMAPETYRVLMDNPAMRKALMNNEFARAVLKHCASPCFPPNATPKNIADIQAILVKLQGKKKALSAEDVTAINEYLYKNRDNLNAAIETLNAIKDPAELREQIGKAGAKDYVLPEGWKYEAGKVSSPLEGIMEYGKDLPKEQMSMILKHLATVAPDGTGPQMATVRDVLKMRVKNPEMAPQINKLIYGLATKGHFELALRMTDMMNKKTESTNTVLKKLSIGDLMVLDKGHMPLTKENIDQLAVMTEHIKITEIMNLVHLLRQSGYPPPKDVGGINVDIDRLVNILKKLKPGEELVPSQVQIKIMEANEAVAKVSKTNFKLDLDKSNFEKDYSKLSDDVNLESDLKRQLDTVILKDPAIQQLVDKTTTAAMGDNLQNKKADFTDFSAITDRMRGMLKDFLTKTIKAQVEADCKRALNKDTVSKAELDAHIETLMNKTLNTTRGSFYEQYAKSAQQKSIEARIGKDPSKGGLEPGSKAMGEYALGVKKENSNKPATTYPDTTNVEITDKAVKITFFEYKTGKNTTSDAQNELQGTVKATKNPDEVIANLVFNSPKAKELEAIINKAKKDGKEITFDYIVIEENPSKKK